ncbi:acyl-CoA synthetase [Agaricus bisporus var. bisporus H97]|uniref:acyl-CoA synthetase n=1 Tax=Agaricus bisporus var. bisporus (strain H97 / ATCC MYA-4626 / FGSC 10389) TaxID=936046 RepID=UPI00029F65BF|nr:acyl-CoA synthetase [Agaricus bisporus var. bisporus H97]EKV48765.1 acyl-CoA synthetase [Agaricus bisporus var. bisporus H97]
MSEWKPKRTLAEAEALLCAPGTPHEIETRLVDGRLHRVYKNLWPSLRAFWLSAAKDHANATYVVYEQQRYTYQQVFERSVRAAAMYRDVYGIRKGDRVAICSRNYPEYLVAFWACHLIGAVSVLGNAWMPTDLLHHCFSHTQSKLIIIDCERADRLESSISKLVTDTKFLVLEGHEGKGKWNGMLLWEDALNTYSGDSESIITTDPDILPEDNASILFTSGTTGLPKGVLSTQRQWLTNGLNLLVGIRRAALRRGDDLPVPVPGPQKSILISVPFFHVTGSTTLTMLATMGGLKIVLMRKWSIDEATRLIKQEDAAIAGGVPSMVSDLSEGSLAGYPLESLMFGGAPAHSTLPERARKAFPQAVMGQGYGLTETNSVAVSVGGEDYDTRPTTCGLPTPVNDVVIMDGDKKVSAGTVGEVWLRGPNVMKEYWGDKAATDKALTKDGWFKTGDLGLLDQEGFLHIRDRIKDIIIRGGENIDSVSVENALYADPYVSEAAAVGVPHPRLGELVAAVVSVRPENKDRVTEKALIVLAEKRLPKFAVPVMVIILDTPFVQTASGKVLKSDLRKMAQAEWQKRQGKILSKL